MNIKHYLSAAAAITLFAACSDYDPGESGNVVDLTDAEIETIEEYTANFINRYGEPAEGHTWGFGAKGSEDEMGTRAVNTNRNNWYLKYQDGSSGEQVTTWKINTNELPEDIKIPGFPSDVDERYYIEKDNTVVGYDTKEEMQEANTSVSPVGDVTDEEIEYVSWWFRTHPGPTTTVPPFTEYFVQDISQDFDRESYPDGEWKDMNDNGTKRLVPVILHKADGTTQTETPEGIGYDMDYFSVKTSDEVWEHNNNFNKGKANPIAEEARATATDTTALTQSTTIYPNRTLKYWTSEGWYNDAQTHQDVYKDGSGYTTSFSYHNSDDNTDYQRYKLVHLQFYGPRTGKWYDGYYLGFDYELHKRADVGNGEYKTTDIIADGYYSNWIVKIAPGDPNWKKDDHTWHRVMCEDLGATDDYDFNDLVYDVYFTGTSETGYTAHIKVQASGGTLPIYVGTYTETDARECHQILQNGNASMSGERYVPVNVAAGVTADPVEITFEMRDKNGNWYDATKGTDPDYIPILVTSLDKSRQEAAHKNTFELLHTTESVVPQKICIDGNLIDATKVRWMKERKQIETSYTLFDSWVTGGSNSDYHFGKSQDWTNHGLSNTGNLY